MGCGSSKSEEALAARTATPSPAQYEANKDDGMDTERAASDDKNDKQSDVDDKDTEKAASEEENDEESVGDEREPAATDEEHEESDGDEREPAATDEEHNEESDGDEKESETAATDEENDDGSVVNKECNSGDASELNELDAEEITRALITGSMTVTYPSTVKVVRIFTSSTFTDTQVERNSLMQRVYPKLKEYCQSIGYEFQVVDMRWGVRDESTEDHLTSQLCMKELEECQKLSTGPNFITFLGQKYGYRPFPPSSPAEKFELLLKNVANAEDADLLKDWFRRDDNAVPAVYWLTPITEKLPEYADSSNPDKQKEARGTWWSVFERMQVILRNAADVALSDKADKHRYYWAVTEEEIANGILQAKDTDKHCYWFKRVITDLKEHKGDKSARFFMDIGTGADDEAFNLLEDVRNVKIPNALSEKNISTYNVKWAEKGINPDVSKEHAQYIDGFCEDFHATLRRMIDDGVQERNSSASLNKLEEEISRHIQFAQAKCSTFYGRTELLDRIKNQVLNSRTTVLVGEPGCGKTALMSKVIQSASSWIDGECAVVSRFISTTSDSASIRALLTSVCQQLRKLFEENEETPIPEQMGELKAHFIDLLSNADSDKPLFIILDSLDQLSNADDGRDMVWLPDKKEIPDDVYFILSTLPGEQFEVLPQLKVILPAESFVDVPRLEESDISEIATESLKQKGRTLQPAQMEVLQKACRTCSLPLYLKLSLDESYRWKSYTVVDETALGKTVEQTINFLLDRVEKYHGHVLVSRALGYITASRSGLGESELEDILSCDDEVLNDVYQYHTPPLRRLPPLLWVRIRADLRDYLTDRGVDNIQVVMWYHRQFIEVAKTRYLADDNNTCQLHDALADFFCGMWSGGKLKGYTDKKGSASQADRLVAKQPLVFDEMGEGAIFNYRKLNQLPYHLILSKRRDELKKDIFFNYTWLHTKTKATGINSIIDDLQFAEDHNLSDSEMKLLHKTLPLCRPALIMDSGQLNCQLVGRLMASQKIEEYPHIQELLRQAKAPNHTGLIVSQGYLKPGDGPVEMRYAGIETPLNELMLTAKQDYMVGVIPQSDKSFQYALPFDDSCLEYFKAHLHQMVIYVWKVSNGKLVKKFTCQDDVTYIANGAILCNNDQWVAMTSLDYFQTSEKCDLVVWNLFAKDIVYRLTIGKMKEDEHEKRHPLCRLNGQKWVAALTADKVCVVDIVNRKVVFEVDYPTEKGLSPHENDESYLVGSGKKFAFRRRGSGILHVYDLDAKAFTAHLKICDDKFTKKMVALVSIVDSGIILCETYNKDEVPGLKNGGKVFSNLKSFDINTGTFLKDLPQISHQYFTGFEKHFPVPGKDKIFIDVYSKLLLLDLNDGTATNKLDFTGYLFAMAVFSESAVAKTDTNNWICVDYVNVDNADTGNLMQEYMDNVYTIRVMPGTQRYIMFTSMYGIHVWDFLENREARRIQLNNLKEEGGKRGVNTRLSLPLSSTQALVVLPSKCPAVIDVVNGNVLKVLDTCKLYSKDDQLDNEASPRFDVVDSHHFICPSLSKKGQVDVWDTNTGTCESFSSGKQELAGVRVSRNGMLAIMVPKDGKDDNYKDLILWNLQTKKQLKSAPNHQGSAAITAHTGVVTHPDGTYITFVDYNSASVHLWNTLAGKATELDESAGVSLLGFSKQLNSVVMIFGNERVELRDLDSLSTIRNIPINVSVQKTAFPYKGFVSPDGMTYVVNGADYSSLYVFDLDKGILVGSPACEKGMLDYKVIGRHVLLGSLEVSGPVHLQIYDPSSPGGADEKLKEDKTYIEVNLDIRLDEQL